MTANNKEKSDKLIRIYEKKKRKNKRNKTHITIIKISQNDTRILC